MAKEFFIINIETERLLIRKIVLADLDDALEHRLDNEVSRFTADPLTREEAVAFYEGRRKPWQGTNDEWLILSIVLKEENKAIGELGFNFLSTKNKLGEIGYRINPKYQRNGYASEAAQALIGELFEQKHVQKLVAICDPRNTASYQMMEKLGMEREAHFKKHGFRRGEWIDEYVYALWNPAF